MLYYTTYYKQYRYVTLRCKFDSYNFTNYDFKNDS